MPPPPFNYIVRMSHFCASILVRYQKSYLAEGFQFSSTFLLFDIKKQYFIIQYYSFFYQYILSRSVVPRSTLCSVDLQEMTGS